jgi:hypothetical protein
MIIFINRINPFTPNDLYRRRALSALKIKIPSKNMREKPTNTPIIHSVHQLCMVAPTCFGITLPSSGSVPSACLVSNLHPPRHATKRGAHAHHVTRHNTPIHNILSTAHQLSISQKALGTPLEDGNVMPKRVGATTNN